jgi:methylmalonyl-CoA/ethylmalonyl-CoA epimerase
VTTVNELPAVDGTFDHVAMAVPRIVDALPLYRDLLGGQFFTGGDNARLGYRGVQLKYAGGKVEILEPLAGSSFLESFFAKRSIGGLHHITYLVPDLRTAIATTEAAGYTVHGEHSYEARWQEVFVHPRQANGLLLQLAQVGPGYGPDPWTLEQTLAGHGNDGTGRPSPGYTPGP